jgi:hypothetical protein
MGIPEYEARRYGGLIKEGRALLSVPYANSDWVSRATVLENVGADDVSATEKPVVISPLPIHHTCATARANLYP